MHIGSEGGKNQDFEINLAPIIDCFTVLITYLLVTASFITLTAVDVGVSATGEASTTQVPVDPPPMFMLMEMKLGHVFVIKISGGKLTQDVVIEVNETKDGKGGKWNYSEMMARLQQIQKKWAAIGDVSISAEPTILYKDIVETINEIKKIIPKVYISG